MIIYNGEKILNGCIWLFFMLLLVVIYILTKIFT